MLCRVAETHFDEWIAQRYETLWPELFDPAVLDPAVDFLSDLPGAGPVLELGIGTGRVALPLSRRRIRVHGIELSPAMVAQLQTQHGASDISVTIGDFATAKAGATFTLAYLLRNTITNLTTQDEQVECFRNVAAHLEPGGWFVIENYIPELQRLPPWRNPPRLHRDVCPCWVRGVRLRDADSGLAPLLGDRWQTRSSFLAPSLRLAFGARPDGTTSRDDIARALEQLAP
jgi:SAM-dependent methyltransferase